MNVVFDINFDPQIIFKNLYILLSNSKVHVCAIQYHRIHSRYHFNSRQKNANDDMYSVDHTCTCVA